MTIGSREQYIGMLKSAFVSIGKDAVVNFLMSQAPGFFGNFLVSPILGWLLTELFEKMTELAELQVFFKFIDMRVGKQASEWEAAAFANYYAQQGTDENAKKKALDTLRLAHKNFIVLSA